MSWTQRSLQNHHQMFQDRCPEKIEPLPKKIGPLFHADMSGKYGTGLNLGPVSISDKTSYRKISWSLEQLVSRPRDWQFGFSYRFEIWEALRQHYCRSACQISERLYNSKYKSRDFEILRDLTIGRLIRYWNGTLFTATCLLLTQWDHPCWYDTNKNIATRCGCSTNHPWHHFMKKKKPILHDSHFWQLHNDKDWKWAGVTTIPNYHPQLTPPNSLTLNH